MLIVFTSSKPPETRLKEEKSSLMKGFGPARNAHHIILKPVEPGGDTDCRSHRPLVTPLVTTISVLSEQLVLIKTHKTAKGPSKGDKFGLVKHAHLKSFQVDIIFSPLNHREDI